MLLLEKAYAKWYGSYGAIEGGLVYKALCDFVPGSIGECITMTSASVKAEIRSGALWEKLKQFVQLGYLLGAGSPSEWWPLYASAAYRRCTGARRDVAVSDDARGSAGGSDTDVSSSGIVQGHAYSLLDAREESDARGTHQLVQLRNPWGGTEW